MNITVVIPTYNEISNLEELVKKIAREQIPNLSILVVDDNSPDGTGELAEKLKKEFPLSVLHRKEKQGLGSAYVEAFSFLLSLEGKQKVDYIFEMDADLSHNPGDFHRFLDTISNADVVLGSRYVPGGKVENWGVIRRLISRFGNTYARFVLGLSYHDLTGGFKLYKREVLEAIDLQKVSSVGYNFQIETTYRAHKKNFSITEIPIVFSERKNGVSKFNLRIILESFWRVIELRIRG